MDGKFVYGRQFLMLNREDTGYGEGCEPSGYIKIEAKENTGRITVLVQNLKVDEKNYDYKVYLMKYGSGDFGAVCMGNVCMNKGKAELVKEFNLKDVCGSGIPVNELNSGVIVACYNKSNSSRIAFPLAACKGSKAEWKRALAEFIKAPSAEKEDMLKKTAAEDVLDRYEARVCSKYILSEDRTSDAAGEIEKDACGSSGKFVDKQAQTCVLNKDVEQGDEEIAKAEALQEPVETEAAEEPAEMELLQKQAEENAVKDAAEELAEAELLQRQAEEEVSDEPGGEDAVNARKKAVGDDAEAQQAQSRTALGNEAPEFKKFKEILGMLDNDEAWKMPSSDTVGRYCLNNPAHACPPENGSNVNAGCSSCAINNFRNEIPRPVQAAPANIKTMDKLRECLNNCFESCEPFGSKRKDYQWWKVQSPVHLNNIIYQFNIRSSLLFNPKVLMAHFKYRHLIVGIYTNSTKNKEYMVCGVPGVYGMEDRPFGEACRWAQVEGNRPRYGAFGYWLVYIDIKTGKVIYLG